MFVSLITWDGGFRESFHTAECAASLTSESHESELIWTEYYAAVGSRLETLVSGSPRLRVLCLNLRGEWHAGVCMNEGAKRAKGDLLIFTDGDVYYGSDFLDQVVKIHQANEGAAIYFRRYDQIKQTEPRPIDPGHLAATSQPMKNFNFGAGLAIAPGTFWSVGGFSTHPVFAGAGRINGELYIRLRNAGTPIIIPKSPKLYHPWHPNSSGTGDIDHLERKFALQEYVCDQEAVNVISTVDDILIDQYIRKSPFFSNAESAQPFLKNQTAVPAASKIGSKRQARRLIEISARFLRRVAKRLSP
ncbi:MAG: glycosyltransferase [Lentisphaeria bacterium]|nr:glycosyltransferase [Lentisphaeria bacterium]